MSRQFSDAVEAFQRGDLDRARALAEAETSAADSPQAHHLLGLIHCRLGDPSVGVEHLRAACEAEPENASFRVMLMRAMVDAGRAAEVLEMREPPPIQSSAALEQWRARAEAADAAGRTDTRIEAWSKVAAAYPSDWRAWANLGNALTAESRWNEVIEALAKAVRLNPSEAPLYWSLGSALCEAGRAGDALPMLNSFEQLVGRTADSALARARCELALAHFDEAEEAYREAVRLAPTSIEATRELGLLLERMNKLDSLNALIEEGAAAGIPEERLAHLHIVSAHREGRFEEAYALLDSVDPDEDQLGWYRVKVKVADRLSKSAEAFAAAETVNRMTPDFDRWRARGADYRAKLRRLGRTLSAMPRILRLEDPGRPMPAFLVGFPRSGTTLLDTFLMGHPDIVVLEEENVLAVAERQIGKAAELPRASRQSLEKAREAYFEELDRHVESGFAGVVVDKLPLNLLGAPLMESMFPGSPIIFAERHPCDSVLSAFMQSFVMNDAMASFLTIEDAADLYDAVMSGWRAIREALPLNVHTVRYERLVRNPESELPPVVDFLGLEWNNDVLAHTKTARSRGAIITPSYDQVTEPLTTRSVGRWRRYEEQLKPVLPVLLPWAKWLGYDD